MYGNRAEKRFAETIGYKTKFYHIYKNLLNISDFPDVQYKQFV
jgi:hypothetical protein